MTEIYCLRCGSPATNHFEGDGKFLDFCDGCLSDLEDWIDETADVQDVRRAEQ